MTNSNYGGTTNCSDFRKDIRDLLVDGSLEKCAADLLVDATTTLAVPRDLSMYDEVPRSASLFLTPSGNASVLLLEDSTRGTRLDCLEAQYYRAILNEEWGKNHIFNKDVRIRVGAGCRDRSLILPFDKVQMHAGALSLQLREIILRDAAHIWVGQKESDSATLKGHLVTVSKVSHVLLGEWTLVIDAVCIEKLKSYRNEKLPNETGGIIIGYSDMKIKRHYVVDILSAPEGSIELPGGFRRGVGGLTEQIIEIKQKTGDQVSYIGEWHSHPDGVPALPSGDDLSQLNYVAGQMRTEGKQALMIIVDDETFQVYLGEAKEKITEVRFGGT